MKQVRLLSEIVPNDWKIETLDKLTDVIFVGTDPVGGKDSHSDVKTDYRIIQSSPVHDGYIDITKVGYVDKNTYDSLISVSIKENDVLLNQLGNGATFARSCVAQRNILPAIITRSVGCIRCDPKKLYPWFLNAYLVLPSTKKYIESFDSGSSRRAIDGSKMKQFLIPHPINIEAQRKIGKFYKTILDKIEVNNKINHELEAMGKTIYDYWFVQFDFPDANGKPYKSSGGKMVYNKELKREIPEGWNQNLISNWIDHDKSGDWGKESIEGNYTEKVSCIRGADINGINGKGEVKAPTRYILKKNTHKILDPHDLVVEISGGSPTQSTGRLTYITDSTLERFDNPLICSNFCKALTLKKEKYLYNFVFQWNRLYDHGGLFGWEGKTSGIKNLLFDSFVTHYKVVMPDENLVEKFYDYMEPIQNKIQKNLLENQKLTELRDWLLPMLMNGQVTIGEAKTQLGMVAEETTKYNK